MTRQNNPAVNTRNDPRWTAVITRDPAVERAFVYAVKTTGIYCRPNCPSRRAKSENVIFYNTSTEAERDGFRPCKRCQPDQRPAATRQATKITELCRFIEHAEQIPTLHELAQQSGLSAYHLHRVFKAMTGLTPKAYAAAHRAQRVQRELARSASVTAAIFDAGYNSSGGFYGKSAQVLGMTPSEYRTGGANVEIRFAIGACSLGAMLVACSVRGVCAILLGDDADYLSRDLRVRFPAARLIAGDNDFEQLIAKIINFIDAPRFGVDLPLDIRGTVFQQRVWQALQDIPVGQTASYTDIARRIGAPKAARAVAGACAANPLAVVIPCHRVVRSNGDLSGYRWGIERKRILLEKEAKE